MLARLQQFTTLSLFCAALAWGVYFGRQGELVWAVAGVALILLGYALFLAVEFILLARLAQSDPAPKPTPAQLLRAWWAEVLTAPRVFCWRQPFRSRAEPNFTPAGAEGRRGVVLVHGFVCNRGLWNPWMARLCAEQIPYVAVNLEPLFGSIDQYVAVIEKAVSHLEAATGTAPTIVAHSMGGLATRAWLAACNGDHRVHHIYTIGTPHHGTWLARFGHTTNARQMRTGSDWLTHLARQEPPTRYAKFTCFYSHCDNIVFPARNATLPGARNLHVPGSAHVHLAFQQEVLDEVLLGLRRPSFSAVKPGVPAAEAT
ncbi:MAG: permease [Methylibium sp. NZG]|nr:MAG: permease [Methylibium sp. NZG]